MAEEKEAFVERWSRLKREADAKPAEAPKPVAAEEAPPPLPPVDQLTPESDFAPFMHPKVSDALRRVALKKLFSDPRFNVPDPYEAYSGDWTGGEAIPEEMLKTLNQARTLLFKEDEAAKTAEARQPAQAAPEGGAAGEKPTNEGSAAEETAKDHGAGRKDS